jgi:flagellar motility protein MotE (MotC chaperone)
MFYIIRKVFERVRSFDAVFDRLDKIEAQLDKHQKLADENESLWQFLDEQKEMEGVWAGSVDEFQDEISDMMIRKMKPQGDA